ncbi:hypothetical protein VHEMI00736 [[Torrubiella] hemipterigena]|uniref:Hydrophobin n=1 Tax=[Torrubiella] hemipterigena TaxID=1531966 RepID=A0A0A1T386_9HYPO|nr:hypothetical protein VHEMI00736 [[Torrubiella] hemipterigena]
MQFAIATVVLAAVAVAAPPEIPNLSKMTAGEAGEYCGSGMELNCCNRQVDTKTADIGPHQSGLLAGILNGALGGAGGSILGDCSPIDVASLIGAGAILNGQTCRGKVACCNRSQSVAVGGLINAALPCIALGSVIN